MQLLALERGKAVFGFTASDVQVDPEDEEAAAEYRTLRETMYDVMDSCRLAGE